MTNTIPTLVPNCSILTEISLQFFLIVFVLNSDYHIMSFIQCDQRQTSIGVGLSSLKTFERMYLVQNSVSL